MDTLETLKAKLLKQLQIDAKNGCSWSQEAFDLKICYNIAKTRTFIGDMISANRVLTFTYNNYR
jgi:chromosome condensin MukBEF complex kleisin-like MukF subunit